MNLTVRINHTIKSLNRHWGQLQNRILFNSLSNSKKELINAIRGKRLTYLSKSKFLALHKVCQYIERHKVEGIIVEAGCALGGSGIFISKLKNRYRPFNIYDVFEMIPSPSEKDPKEVHERYNEIVSGKSQGIGGDVYYGYKRNLYKEVISNFETFGINLDEQNIQLIRGLLQDTMIIDGPVALAHIDVDWYEPVKTSLERIFPHLSPGGFIVLDDYFDWGGCREAVDEFLSKTNNQYRLDPKYGSLIIQKVESE